MSWWRCRCRAGAARVRLIGIDAPEVVGPGEPFQCYGAEATSRAGELLAGQSVRLELDASQGERDAAGNLLAYVWLQDGSMYNARMIAEGFALERSGPAAYRYQGQFKNAEQQARSQQVGLWHPGSCTGEVPTPTSGRAAASPHDSPGPASGGFSAGLVTGTAGGGGGGDQEAGWCPRCHHQPRSKVLRGAWI